MWRHRRVGVLDVDVVAGARHHLVARAEPGDARLELLVGESRQVSSWSPVRTSTGQRTWRISASSIATLNSLGTPTPNIGSAFHTQPPSTSRAPWRARCSAHSGGRRGLLRSAVLGHLLERRPRAAGAEQERGRCGRTTAGSRAGISVGRHHRGRRADRGRRCSRPTAPAPGRRRPRRWPGRRRRSGRRTPTGPPPRWRISSARSRWNSVHAKPVSSWPLSPWPRKSTATDVVAERRDPRRQAVEHAAVVVGAVQAQHERVGRIAPAPRAQGGAVEVDELRPLGLRDGCSAALV